MVPIFAMFFNSYGARNGAEKKTVHDAAYGATLTI
jgi:hypothetical protein